MIPSRSAHGDEQGLSVGLSNRGSVQTMTVAVAVKKGDRIVLAADSLVPAGAGGLEDVTTGYGLANWHLYNGRRAEAERVLGRILSVKSQWPAFGYLAAEAEAKRLGLRAPETTAP